MSTGETHPRAKRPMNRAKTPLRRRAAPKTAPQVTPPEKAEVAKKLFQAPKTANGLKRLAESLELRMFLVMPSNHNAIVFSDSARICPLDINGRADRKLVRILREEAVDMEGKPWYEPSVLVREGQYDAVCESVDPMTDHSMSDDTRNDIEATVDCLPSSAVVRPKDVALASGVIHQNETPSRVKSMCSLTRKILRERRFAPGDPVHAWYSFNEDAEIWIPHTHRRGARCWSAPRNWEPTLAPGRQALDSLVG